MSNINDILVEMEDYALKENVPIMNKEGIDFMCNLISENNVKSILEIGSAIGYSSIKMALCDKDILVTTIERDKTRYSEAVKNINNCKLDDRINIINDDALDTDIKGKYDLIFIDAAKGQNIKFFNKYKDNLNDKGVIVTDNMLFHGLVEEKERIRNKNLRQLVNKIKKYIEFLKDNKEYNTTFYRIGDGIAVSYKKED